VPAPNYFLGQGVTSLNVYTGARDGGTGVMTWSTTANSIPPGSDGAGGASLDYFRVSDMRLLEMIVPVGAVNAHYEKILNDSAFVIGEILKKSGNVLQTLVDGNDYLKVVAVMAPGTYTYHGIIRNFNDGASALGKNSHEVTLAPFWDGTNLPLQFTAAS
jgi:hypothetical protein